MLRLFPLLLVSACGGFTTPPQDVSVGLALSGSRGLPPTLTEGQQQLVLTRVRLTGTATVDSKPLATLKQTEVPLNAAWVLLASGPLARGDYQQVELELTALSVEGTWAAAGAAPRAFVLDARQARTEKFTLHASWRVEAGKASAVSFVADPAAWMSNGQGPMPELIDPTEEHAGDELMDRFFKSLTAARDDNHDGLEDLGNP